MEELPHGVPLAGHIAALAARSASETDALIAMLERGAWPGGTADRCETGALEWVRRWGPGRIVAAPSDCSCAVGRCSVCN